MTLSFDIAALQAGYRDGSLRPPDILEEAYRRIAAMGAAPVWISLRPREDALARLEAAPRGPLYGIPFAVKDNIDVAGLETTCACPAFAYRPDASAAAVERLESAGAICVGKTNMDQFATGLVGTRSPYGIPSSVFNPEYISGGSSSGSAVAVAAGLVSFALGTDTAGSGRVPAAFNNLVGLKPTKGLISTRGVVPACRTQDVVSIFALTATDAMAVLDIAMGFDARDPYARPQGAAEPRRDGIKRIGIPRGELDFCGNAENRALFEATVSRARDAGFEITTFDYSDFAAAAKLLYQGPWVAERLAAIKSFAEQHPEALDPVVGKIILGAASISATAAFEGFYELARLIREAESEWATMDAMLLPTAPMAYTIAEVAGDPIRLNSNLGLYTNFVNLMDLSAIAFPAGFRTDGLPFGVTLIAKALSETPLAVAADRLHRAISFLALGGTRIPLAATPAFIPAPAPNPATSVAVAVVGAHLSGQPLNAQLIERNARLVRTTRTAPGYSFYALANTTPAKPGLIFDGKGAGGIEVEVWEMGLSEFGSFVALIPPPLGIGTLTLSDGSTAKGFLCEPHGLAGATDITSSGGWRAWLRSSRGIPGGG